MKEEQSLNTCTLISNLKDITLLNFIQCAVHQELHLLVISGEPTQEQLQAAWWLLQSDYYMATGNEQMKQFISLQRRVDYLRARIFDVQNCVSALQVVPNVLTLCPEGSAAVIEVLKAYGHHHKYKPQTIEADLKKVITKEKANVLAIRKLEPELKKLAAAGDKKETPTEEGFYQTLLNINKVEGTAYHENDLNMYKYCILLKRLQAHIEHLNKTNNGNGTH